MKRITNLLMASLVALNGFAQVAGDEDKEMFNRGLDRDQASIDKAKKGWWKASMEHKDERLGWWREARFGMFIHWGVYSLPGNDWKGKEVGGYAEHLMRKEKISRKEYLELAHQFNPVKFNANEWISMAKQAGMRYFIITAKHHDGFAMYPSKVSDFTLTKQTPFKRDPLMELKEACKKQGLKFGFYYSHAFDWEDPNAPGNDWEYKNPGGDKSLFGGLHWYNQHPELLKKVQKYIDEKAIPQIVELLNTYHPDILWFDTPHKIPLSENIRILEAIRKAAPNVVVNGRLARTPGTEFGDYQNTADRPAEFFPVTGDWEAIPTTNESYGYSKFDHSHKSVGHFVRLLATAASKGGNLLMNIGPMGNGAFDMADKKILKGIGAWMAKYSESIYGTTVTPLPIQSWGVSTFKAGKLFLQIFEYPKDGQLFVGGLKSPVKKAYWLNQPQKKLAIRKDAQGDLVLAIPKLAPDSLNSVMVLELSGTPQVDAMRYLAPNTETSRMLAYDAQRMGGNLGYGDGKSNRYYVYGWKSTNQALAWTFRNSKKESYQVVLKYASSQTCKGTASLALDGRSFGTVTVAGSGSGDTIQDQVVGNIWLEPGTHEITLKALKIEGKELMKPMEIQLIKLKK